MINIVEKGKNPHLSLCHRMQSYSANNRPVSLLMKSNIKLTDELIKSIESLGLSDVEEIKKASSYKQKKELLTKALQESFCDDDEWCYVEDFDDAKVVFWKGCELYQTTYSIDASFQVELGQVAEPVIEITSYQVIGDELEVNEEYIDSVEEGMAAIVMKAFEDPEKSAHIAKSYFEKSKLNAQEFNKGTEVPVENNLVVKSELVSEGDKASDDNNTTINKSKENNEMSDNAVVDFTKSAEFIAMQKSLSDLQEQLQKANDEKLAIQKAKDESDKADMLTVLKGYSFVGDEAENLTEALFKNSAALVVLQTLEKAHKAIDAVATVEKGADAPEQVAKTASQSEQDDVMALIKAKKSAKK